MKRLRLLVAVLALGLFCAIPALAQASLYSLQDYPKDAYLLGSDKLAAQPIDFNGSIEASAVSGYLNASSHQVPERLQQRQELYKVTLRAGHLYTLHYAGLPVEDPKQPSFLGNEIMYAYDEDGKILNPATLTGTVDSTGVNLWLPVKEDTVIYFGCSSKDTVDATTHAENLVGAGPFNFTVREQTGGYVFFDTQLQGVDVEPQLLTTAPAYAAEPQTPVSRYHTFQGWFTEPEYTTPWDFSKDEVPGTMTLYAKWAENPTYIVTFDPQMPGVSVETTSVKTIPALVPEPEKPEAPAGAMYSFAGWFKDAQCLQSWNFATDVVSRNVTLYGKWKPKEFDIYYVLDGGTLSDAALTGYVFNGGDTPLLPATRIGYTFMGWYDNSDFAGDALTSIANGSSGAKTLYAKWSVNTYKVTFNSMGGSSVAPATVTYGSTLTKPVSPKRSNYVFKGWYADRACTKAWNFSTNKVKGATTLYAKWYSTDSYLKTIRKSVGVWSSSQPFKKSGGTMQINVPRRASAITVHPIKSNSSAKMYMKIDGGKYYRISSTRIRVNHGKIRKVVVKVVPQSGSARYYTVKISRR